MPGSRSIDGSPACSHVARSGDLSSDEIRRSTDPQFPPAWKAHLGGVRIDKISTARWKACASLFWVRCFLLRGILREVFVGESAKLRPMSRCRHGTRAPLGTHPLQLSLRLLEIVRFQGDAARRGAPVAEIHAKLRIITLAALSEVGDFTLAWIANSLEGGRVIQHLCFTACAAFDFVAFPAVTGAQNVVQMQVSPRSGFGSCIANSLSAAT